MFSVAFLCVTKFCVSRSRPRLNVRVMARPSGMIVVIVHGPSGRKRLKNSGGSWAGMSFFGVRASIRCASPARTQRLDARRFRPTQLEATQSDLAGTSHDLGFDCPAV